MPRVFIAVSVGEDIRQSLYNLSEKTAQESPGLRPVAPHQHHITLKFLGDIEKDRIELVGDATESAVNGSHVPFFLTAIGIGAFPNTRQARVIWAGVSGECNKLRDLHINIEEQLVLRGFPRDNRRFKPHITMARLRNPGPIPTTLQRYTEHEFGRWQVDRVLVMESRLSQTGSTYATLYEFKLNSPGGD